MAGMAGLAAPLDAQGPTARAFGALAIIQEEDVRARSGIETV
jgi:hypothetical protein